VISFHLVFLIGQLLGGLYKSNYKLEVLTQRPYTPAIYPSFFFHCLFLILMTEIDEETPLLQEINGKKRPTPLPWFQFSIVFVSPARRTVDFASNIPFRAAGMCYRPCASRHSSNKTSFQLIRDLGITNGNESQVGYYVGLMVRGAEISGAVSSLT
jgi:hypothetical protein